MTNRVQVSPDQSENGWSEIEEFVAGITELSQTPQSLPEFASNTIDRTAHLVQADAGYIWLANGNGEVHLIASNSPDAPDSLAKQHPKHASFLQATLRSDGVLFETVEPAKQKANSESIVWMGVACQLDHDSTAIIELVQRGELSPDARVGHERLMLMVSQLTASFARQLQSRQFDHAYLQQQQQDGFTRLIHRDLQLGPTAYRIVNEGRRLIGCDRLSLLVADRQRFKVTAVSGVDTIDRNGPLVRQMQTLAEAVARSKHWLHYRGDTNNLPEQLQEPLDDFINEANSIAIDVVPLSTQVDNDQPASQQDLMSECLGLFVVEYFRRDRQRVVDESGLESRILTVASLSVSALENSLEYESLPLLRLSRGLRGVRRWSSTRRTRLLSLVTFLVLGLLALILVPTTFYVHTPGIAQPSVQRHLFAPMDAEVIEVLCEHDQRVQQDQPLVHLQSRTLDLDLQRLRGDYQATEKKLLAIASARVQQNRNDDRSRSNAELAAEENVLQQRLENLSAEIQLTRTQRDQLHLRSPITGHLLTWDPSNLLVDRPVARGQRLLTVADLDGPWKIEARIPERQAGHVKASYATNDQVLQVVFTTTDGTQHAFEGQLVQLSGRADLDEDSQLVTRARVTVPDDARSLLRPGTELRCKIDCGQRPIGFVWFHELFESLRSWFVL
ncbi:efflux RND transporter periplasmic adaptor subunit [Stieleria sp. JC731]|uniref:efflux RND transporter periplasmic adaptor subunit n=1 Tax=Pirellulaceae TaxID=2691357 RepID=UPI001E33FD7E|nr:HlyD family efflux transporter periplasmic adaptor subunit [Stieleria sp. JC731]MCC9603435.1 efflux RND transporter periplasmic adaptor subunit [Stieleria sp. JC731]